jgi:hypothetical protein
MFEDIKQMLPARVKATTGLLIEPHFLERNKVEHKKPTAELNDWKVTIDTTTQLIGEAGENEALINTIDSYQLFGENQQYNANISSSIIENITSENYQYESNINAKEEITIISEFNTYDSIINTKLSDSTKVSEIELVNSSIIVGQNDYEVLGFGIYAQSGSAIRTYYDARGNRIKERVRVSLIKEENTRTFTYLTGSISNRLYTEIGTETYYETKINIQPFSGSTLPTVGGKIVEVTPLNGYLKSHYRNTNDLTRGLQNSFYNGSKNTSATTLDGSLPVETFLTNPNTLRVSKAGRDASEPILEVE